MCECANICMCYKMLKKHNESLCKIIKKHISTIESFICALNIIADHDMSNHDNVGIEVQQDLIGLIKNLIPKKCTNDPKKENDLHCHCTDLCYELEEDYSAFYVIDFRTCNDKYGRKCKCKLKYISLACLARFQNEKCEYEFLCSDDILFNPTDNIGIQRKVNQYIGFKNFFETIIELLDN